MSEIIHFGDELGDASAPIIGGGPMDQYSDEETDNDEYAPSTDNDGDGDNEHTTASLHSLRGGISERTVKLRAKALERMKYKENNVFLLLDDSDICTNPTSRIPGTFGRKMNREPGDSLPAYSRKVTADLDSDDELMMELKQAGYTDQQIADKLAKDGRVRYDRKSVTTRISRIRAAQAKQVDEMLEQGYLNWRYEDDNVLMQAYELADIEINSEIERIRASRFCKVSDMMRKINNNCVFSDKACEARYQAIMEGTASMPTDTAEGHALARYREMENFRKASRTAKAAELAEKEKQAEKERKIKEEARLRQAEKAEAVARARAERQQEKAQRAMKRAAQNQIKLQLAEENKAAKAAELQAAKQRKSDAAAAAAATAANEGTINTSTTRKVDHLAVIMKVKPGIKDPRSYLNVEDLKALCAKRALSTGGNSVQSFVERLRIADDSCNMLQLKAMCRERGLNTAGNKTQAKYQLALAEARGFASYEQNMAKEKQEAHRTARIGTTNPDISGRGINEDVDTHMKE